MTKNLSFILFLFIHVSLFSQELIKKTIDTILSSDNKEEISVLVYDPISMDTIYAKNIYHNLIPASNVKLFTTATALNLLANHEYLITKVFTDDDFIADSIINGNIYLKGFGDALFTSEKLDSLVQRIVQLGIKKITGNVISDESYFDRIYTRDDWITDEHANVTLPPISGLSINRNSVIVKFNSSGTVGKISGCEILPGGDFYHISNNAKITKFKSRPKLNFRTIDNQITLRIDGGVRQRRNPYSYLVYPDSPAVLIAHLFKQRLIDSNIEVTGTAKTGVTPFPIFDVATSQNSLSAMIGRVNKKSDNYLAENLFKIIGAEYSTKEGNSFYATQAALSFLDEQGIYNEGTSLVDGSGISRFNKTSTAAIVSLLEYIYLDIDNFDFFYNSLSIAGKDGTLEDRMYESSAYQNFRGKTGTLNGVSAISGYLTTKQNRDLIVSILMNFNSKGQNYFRGLQDKIISYLAENL